MKFTIAKWNSAKKKGKSDKNNQIVGETEISQRE
jgi:hypothetical protein